MDWKQLIADLVALGQTYQQIGDACGMSKGHVHDLKTGRHDDVLWARGEKLRKLHARLMRRKLKEQ